jgi:hypothetical protein
VTFEFNLKGNRRGAIQAMAMTVLLGAFLVLAMASPQSTERIPLAASQNPSGADRTFSQAVWAGDTL